ncbi:MAG: Heterodimeric efflux ABC transporter, permease/ATP-binding subunit 1 [uncultured Chloroflexia bacterium]|uniref:Heterodimeric efflux ABC transporter, permease/ATP-binding subunit 1 n=1 Tax=uncultured Chloroflexia bacterium TaxID=1672391 RepID=A0A6J4HRL3_9CHLR|nr:MAG: Heterodimeric efflux ABC transporter, permease/ATP-binding subunit 1 [uncultured Chloroflexia bacterium]
MALSVKRYRDLLAAYLWPQRTLVALLAVLLIGSIALQLVHPQILRSFIDTATLQTSALPMLVRLALLFIAVALASQALTVAATYVGENLGWIATNRLRNDLALHCLRLDMAFHKAHTPGEMIERVDGDVTALANFFSQLVVQLLSNLLLLAGVLVLLFREDWRVGLALTLFAAITLVILSRIRNLAVPHWNAAREASSSLFGFVEERLNGTEDIRSSGARPYVLRKLYSLLRRRLETERSGRFMGNIMWSTMTCLLALGTALALGLGAYLYLAGSMTIGTVTLIYFYTEMLRRPLEQISSQLQDLQRAGASIGRLDALLTLQATVVDGSQPLPSAGPLAVAFDRVTFGYDLDDVVLDNLSFKLAPGTVLGLLGRTGSGKTTVSRLLVRLYDPRAGTIRVGGVPLGDARISDLRDRVAMVTQDVQIFNATVRDNITFFDSRVSDEQILNVIETLGLRPWFATLSHGLDTLVAAGGAGLSAGEAQLLACARVFLKDPGLVILDEASSRVDPATERLLDRAVAALLRPAGSRRTAIIIAHRLGTVDRVDEIMILEDGQIVEHGPRERLAQDERSHFARLLRTGLEEALA